MLRTRITTFPGRISRRNLLIAAGLLAPAVLTRVARGLPAGLDARKLGLRCDGSIENHRVVQAALDRASELRTSLIIPGPIRVAGPLYYSSNLTLIGSGANAGIMAAEGLRRDHLISPRDGATHANLQFRGLQFRGTGTDAATKLALLRFAGTDRILLSNCTFADHGAGLVGMFGCSAVTITNCHFTRWQRAPAFHAQAEPHLRPAHDVEIAGNRFDNAQWVALSIYAQRVDIHDNIIHAVGESGIWASRVRGDAMSEAEDLTITKNSISSVRQIDISGTGIEVDVNRAMITENRIVDTDSSGIKILGYCRDVVIKNNIVTDTVRKPGIFHGHSQITLQFNHASEGPARITIEGNVVRDDGSPKRAPFAIGSLIGRGVRPIPSLVIRDNDVRGGYAQAPAFIPPGAVGPGSQISL